MPRKSYKLEEIVTELRQVEAGYISATSDATTSLANGSRSIHRGGRSPIVALDGGKQE